MGIFLLLVHLVGRRAECFGRGDRQWHLLLLFCFLPPVILHLPPLVLHSQWLQREALVQATSLLGHRWERMKWAPDWTPLQGPTFSLTKLLSLSPCPLWCVEQSPFRGWPWFEGSFFTLQALQQTVARYCCHRNPLGKAPSSVRQGLSLKIQPEGQQSGVPALLTGAASVNMGQLK